VVKIVFYGQALDAILRILRQDQDRDTVKPQLFDLPICWLESRAAAHLAPVWD
jgi:hypothetical protein